MISYKIKVLISMMYEKQLIIELDKLLFNLDDKYNYDLFCECIVNYILDDYSRTDEVVKIVCGPSNDDVISMTIFQLLLNLYILEFNFMYKIDITRDWLHNVTKSFLKSYTSNIEKICKKVYEVCLIKKIDQNECFSYYLSNLTERMVKLSELLSPIVVPTMDTIDISKFCLRNSEFNRLINTTLDSTKSFTELEEQLKADGDRLMNVILSDKRNCLASYVESNCLNRTQMTQMFIAVGPRATSTNIIMSHIMTRSFLNGLQNVGDIIAEAEITNKALIYKKKFVGASGYMSRETDLLCGNTSINYEVSDCKTKHFASYYVKDKKYLELVISKNMILPNGKLKMVTAEDTNLIGQTIKLRSICCCANTEYGKVCKTCYGNPMLLKKDSVIGGMVSIEVDNKISNAIMAVKHQSSTDTIKFADTEMLKLFNVEEGKLVLKHKLNPDEEITIIFDKDYIEDIIERLEGSPNDDTDGDVVVDDEDIDADEVSSTISTKMLNHLKVITRKTDIVTGEDIIDEYEMVLDGSFLILSDEMMSKANMKSIDTPIDSDDAILNLGKVKPGTPVFTIKYVTKETSRYLKQLTDIIERAKPYWYINDYDTPLNDFAELVITAGIKDVEFVHLEPLIYNLLKDPNNLLVRPDFGLDKPQFIMINLKTGIFKGDLYSSLLFQELNKTIKDPDSYFKVGKGIHDSQFRTTTKYDFTYMKKALRKAKML